MPILGPSGSAEQVGVGQDVMLWCKTCWCLPPWLLPEFCSRGKVTDGGRGDGSLRGTGELYVGNFVLYDKGLIQAYLKRQVPWDSNILTSLRKGRAERHSEMSFLDFRSCSLLSLCILVTLEIENSQFKFPCCLTCSLISNMCLFPGLTGLFIHKPALFFSVQISFLIMLVSSLMTAKFLVCRILWAPLDTQQEDYTSVPVRQKHLTNVSIVQSTRTAAGLLARG